MFQVEKGQLPVNHQITYLLQDVFNLLPDVTHPEFVKSMYVKTNDQMLVVYVTALTRSIIALNNLINNKLSNRETEKKEMAKKDDVKKDAKEEPAKVAVEEKSK